MSLDLEKILAFLRKVRGVFKRYRDFLFLACVGGTVDTLGSEYAVDL